MSKSSLSGFIWGAVLFLITVIVIQFLTYHQTIELYSMALVLIGSVYLGFGFKETRTKYRTIEIISAAFFIAMAIAGLWITPWIIVAGLLLHGIWDLLHHNKSKLTEIPEWYIPLCVIYDWAAASYLIFIILKV